MTRFLRAPRPIASRRARPARPGGRAVRAAGRGGAQGDAEVQRALDSWYKRAKRRAPGEWGIAIADQTGRIIWSVAEDQPLLPASTVKLFTTGFARSELGGNARSPPAWSAPAGWNRHRASGWAPGRWS